MSQFINIIFVNSFIKYKQDVLEIMKLMSDESLLMY